MKRGCPRRHDAREARRARLGAAPPDGHAGHDLRARQRAEGRGWYGASERLAASSTITGAIHGQDRARQDCAGRDRPGRARSRASRRAPRPPPPPPGESIRPPEDIIRALSERRRDGGFRGLPVLRCESLTDARDASSDEVSSEDARQEETLIQATRWFLRQTSAPPGAPPPATRPHPLSPDALPSLLRSPPLSSLPMVRWYPSARGGERPPFFSRAHILTGDTA